MAKATETLGVRARLTTVRDELRAMCDYMSKHDEDMSDESFWLMHARVKALQAERDTLKDAINSMEQ